MSSTAQVIAEIKKLVQRDKDRGVEAARQAGARLQSLGQMHFLSDITGKPDLNKRYIEGRKELYSGLQGVTRKPFYRRVFVRMDNEVDLEVLITEARGAGGVLDGDGWLLVSYTSTLATQIESKRPGEKVEIQVPKRPKVVYDIGESAKYEILLPQFERAEFFFLKRPVAVFESEAELNGFAEVAAKEPRETATQREYTAKATFGLDDIVVLRDKPQIAAMGLPFAKTVVIEGPPGSGKTSIGLLRLAAMYDRQWYELGLDQRNDQPFHTYSSMRVLVYNPEIVEYLSGLAKSVGVNNVKVDTTEHHLREICRATRMMSGTSRRDRPRLALLKGRREALRAYFAGFKAHVARYWQDHRDEFRREMFSLAPDFLTIADRFDDWVKRVAAARVEGDQIVGGIAIVDGLTAARTDIEREQSRTRRAINVAGVLSPAGDTSRGSSKTDAELRALMAKEVKALVEKRLAALCSRAESVRAMFATQEYVELRRSLEAAGTSVKVIDDGERQWKRQYRGSKPAFSELDLAMSAWLGAKILLTQTAAKPWIGSRLEPLTHIVVDEVQDLSPSHMAVLSSQLARDGTMTLVGDLHQNLNPYAGLRSWDDLGVEDVVRTVFGVNYRQTTQLGEFLGALHTELFGEPCTWKSSSQLLGERPRFTRIRSWKGLADAIAAESRFWRGRIEGDTKATVAVLYDGRMTPKRLKWLQKHLTEALQDDLVQVVVAAEGAGSDALRRTDCVVIASVRQTKGLEFDAVVFVETKGRWSKPVAEIDLRSRNGFYVAASRARAGLSLCMRSLPTCLEPLVKKGLCETIAKGDQE